MATHSCVLAWRIPETGKLSELLSVGSHRVGYEAAAATAVLNYSPSAYYLYQAPGSPYLLNSFDVNFSLARTPISLVKPFYFFSHL